MRIHSQYRPSAFRPVSALMALVYVAALTAGLVLHLQEEGGEAHALVAAAGERAPGEPAPHGPDGRGDLDCLLCQVMATPAHPGSVVASAQPELGGDILPASPHGPAAPRLSPTRSARGPPPA